MRIGRRLGIYLALLAAASLYSLSPVRLGMVCGNSMDPTLRNGEFYLLDRTVPRDNLQRGDVVVFRSPEGPCLKRVVAVGGDELYLLRYLDGEEPFHELVFSWQLPAFRRLHAPDRPPSPARELIRYQVPTGTYYMVGDHHLCSRDSRHFGPVPSERILGRVLFVPPSASELDAVAGVFGSRPRTPG